jgi:GNAT superfamily N-acetyltransferase
MPEEKAFSIRPMKPGDLDQAFGLSMAEGWNQTMNDWKLLLDNPDDICIVAEKEKRVAGTATALNHNNSIAWIGMVLVDKSLRGQGAGKMLLEELINSLKHIQSVKLDATPAGEPLYRKLGFVAEYNILRMTRGAMKYKPAKVSGKEILSTGKKEISEIIRLDKVIFGADRSYLLNTLFNTYPEKAFCLKKNNKIDGFLFGRAGSRFNYIGPVSANSPESAKQLISKSLESLNDQAIAIDVPEDKKDLAEWLESEGFVRQRHFTRMYLNVNPYPGTPDKQFLISGPEFG